MTLGLIIAAIVVAFVLSVIAVKKGWLSDRDGDGVADVIEDKIDDVKEAVKKTQRKKPGRKPGSKSRTSGGGAKTDSNYYKKRRSAKK